MPLKNYSTQVPAEKTIAEIEKILAEFGANKILKDYDGAGNVTSVSFMVETNRGIVPFRLPMNAQAVSQVLKNEKKLPERLRGDINQARRVGWRIIKDWVFAQMSIVALGMVKVEQVFLPYAVHKDGETFFEKIEKKQFSMLQIEKEAGAKK